MNIVSHSYFSTFIFLITLVFLSGDKALHSAFPGINVNYVQNFLIESETCSHLHPNDATDEDYSRKSDQIDFSFFNSRSQKQMISINISPEKRASSIWQPPKLAR